MPERKKVSAIITTYFPRSHADVIVTKYMIGFPADDGFKSPKVDLVSIYLDQVHERDIGQDLAQKYKVPICPSIRSALTLGKESLAVDGVLLIGEHGDYPHNEKGQHMYPRKYMFEQICGVFAQSRKSVPLFCDKHLSYNWSDAKWMCDRANELNVPFMAGSSLPLCWRDPFLEFEMGTSIEEAVGIGYGGIESYGFHALETLQCMVERRRGGESGVAAVQCLEGDAVWKGSQIGRWSKELAEAACQTIAQKPEGKMEDHCKNPAAFLIEYNDGFNASVLMLNGYVHDFAFASKVNGEIKATNFFLQNEDPFGHFSYLSLNIEEMFLSGKPQYPAERTLLASGILDAIMDSKHQGCARLETPHLNVRYKSFESPLIRPNSPRPSGATVDPSIVSNFKRG